MLAVGTVLMLFTIFGITYNVWMILLVNLLAFVVCISYQIKRQLFKQQSISEIIIGNDDKKDVLLQNKCFTITRIPVFILLIITLLSMGNLLIGVGDGVRFGVLDVIYNALVFSCLYYGLKNFFLNPDWLPLILISGGISLAGFIFKTRHNILLFNIDYILAMTWLLVGILYKSKKCVYERYR